MLLLTKRYKVFTQHLILYTASESFLRSLFLQEWILLYLQIFLLIQLCYQCSATTLHIVDFKAPTTYRQTISIRVRHKLTLMRWVVTISPSPLTTIGDHKLLWVGKLRPVPTATVHRDSPIAPSCTLRRLTATKIHLDSLMLLQLSTIIIWITGISRINISRFWRFKGELFFRIMFRMVIRGWFNGGLKSCQSDDQTDKYLEMDTMADKQQKKNSTCQERQPRCCCPSNRLVFPRKVLDIPAILRERSTSIDKSLTTTSTIIHKSSQSV